MAGLLDNAGEFIFGNDTEKDEYGMTQMERRQPVWSGLLRTGALLMAGGQRLMPEDRAKYIAQAGGALADVPTDMLKQQGEYARRKLQAADIDVKRQQVLNQRADIDLIRQKIASSKTDAERNGWLNKLTEAQIAASNANIGHIAKQDQLTDQKIAEGAADLAEKERMRAYVQSPEFQQSLQNMSPADRAIVIGAANKQDWATVKAMTDPKRDLPNADGYFVGKDGKTYHYNMWTKKITPVEGAGQAPPPQPPPPVAPGGGTTPPAGPGGVPTTGPLPPFVGPSFPPPPPSAAAPGSTGPIVNVPGSTGPGIGGRSGRRRPFPGATSPLNDGSDDSAYDGTVEGGGDPGLTPPQVQLAQAMPPPPASVLRVPRPGAPPVAPPPVQPPPAQQPPAEPVQARTGAKFDDDGNMVGAPARRDYNYFDSTNFADYDPAVLKQVEKEYGPEIAAEVVAISRYQEPGKNVESPHGRGNSTAGRNFLIMDLVRQYTRGDYQKGLYNTFNLNRNEYGAKGVTGRNMIALDTVSGHMGDLYDAVKAASPGDSSQFQNRITNAIRTQFGDPRVVDVNTAKLAVAEELSRAFKGANVSDTDIKEWKALMDTAQSPKQWQAVIERMGSLLQSREKAVKAKYGADHFGRRNVHDFISQENRDKVEFIKKNPLYKDDKQPDTGGGGGTLKQYAPGKWRIE